MTEPSPTPEQRYTAIVEALGASPDVTEGAEPDRPRRGFGSSGLKAGGRIFAMLVRGRLVVKLPRQRVDELVAAGHGERFDANRGRPMKEWFVLAPTSALEWLPLADEALEFLRRGGRAR